MDEKNQVIKEIPLENLMAELKEMNAEALKSILPELKTEIINELKPQLKMEKEEDTKEAKYEKMGAFIKDLIQGKYEKKDDSPIDSTTGSMGYSIPTELTDTIMQKVYKIAKMRKLAFVFNMAGPLQIPIEGTGVTTYWVGENEAITDSSPTITKADMGDYYLASRVLMPRQLLNTSQYNIVEYVSTLCSKGIVRDEESAFVAGDGQGKPTGLRQSGISSVGAQAGSKLAYDDIINLYMGTPEQYRLGGVFMTSTKGMTALRKIKDTIGQPIFNVQDQTVFGRPVWENVDIPENLGSGTDTTEFYFFDPSYYWIKDSENMFALTMPIIKNLQIELVIAEAIDGIFTMTDAARKLTAVK